MFKISCSATIPIPWDGNDVRKRYLKDSCLIVIGFISLGEKALNIDRDSE